MIELLATLLMGLCSAWRALNWGHQRTTYMVSIACYLVFIWGASTRGEVARNLIYLATALIGTWRWRGEK